MNTIATSQIEQNNERTLRTYIPVPRIYIFTGFQIGHFRAHRMSSLKNRVLPPVPVNHSPRTGTRSKCLQNPWGVTLITKPIHLRRLQVAVGFSFFTTTNQQIPTCTTYADAFMTQWVFSFLPWQTDVYPRVLHDAFAPIVYGLVYMTQQIPMGTTYTGFFFSPTTT